MASEVSALNAFCQLLVHFFMFHIMKDYSYCPFLFISPLSIMVLSYNFSVVAIFLYTNVCPFAVIRSASISPQNLLTGTK